jgi:hypothetical protein
MRASLEKSERRSRGRKFITRMRFFSFPGSKTRQKNRLQAGNQIFRESAEHFEPKELIRLQQH